MTPKGSISYSIELQVVTSGYKDQTLKELHQYAYTLGSATAIFHNDSDCIAFLALAGIGTHDQMEKMVYDSLPQYHLSAWVGYPPQTSMSAQVAEKEKLSIVAWLNLRESTQYTQPYIDRQLAQLNNFPLRPMVLTILKAQIKLCEQKNLTRFGDSRGPSK